MKAAAYVLLLLVMLALSAPGFTQAPDDKLIVPGQRIGKWMLAMSIDDLVRVNGTGRRTLFVAGVVPAADVVRDFTAFEWGALVAKTFDDKRVWSLVIEFFMPGMAPYKTVKTAEGIGSQSTRAQVLKAYGKPTVETKPQAGETRLIYDKIGIWFRFDSSAAMRNIGVFPAGTAKSIFKFWPEGGECYEDRCVRAASARYARTVGAWIHAGS